MLNILQEVQIGLMVEAAGRTWFRNRPQIIFLELGFPEGGVSTEDFRAEQVQKRGLRCELCIHRRAPKVQDFVYKGLCPL